MRITEELLQESIETNLSHIHDFTTPVFTERRSDAHLILTALACECRDLLDLDF